MYSLTLTTSWGQQLLAKFRSIHAAQVYASKWRQVEYTITRPDGSIVWSVRG